MCVDRVKRNEPFPTSLSDPKIKDKKVWTDSEPIPKDIPTHLRFDNDMYAGDAGDFSYDFVIDKINFRFV